jgi:hypothetical protein
LDRLVPLLEETVSLNEPLKDRLTARALHWGDPDQIRALSDPPPDLIVVADCVYYEASVQPLVATLAALSSSSGCPVLLSYEVRDEFEDKVSHIFFSTSR